MDQDQQDHYIYHSEYTIYDFDQFDLDPFLKIAVFLLFIINLFGMTIMVQKNLHFVIFVKQNFQYYLISEQYLSNLMI
jgi:hypothetical protein